MLPTSRVCSVFHDVSGSLQGVQVVKDIRALMLTLLLLALYFIIFSPLTGGARGGNSTESVAALQFSTGNCFQLV